MARVALERTVYRHEAHAVADGTIAATADAASVLSTGRDGTVENEILDDTACTQVLDETGITKAAVETVAENFSDGVIAPMIYTAIGGPAAGLIYKSINTMDSMIGYRNDRYMNFGTAAAKLDDAVNYIPSRISALLLIAASAVLPGGYDPASAFRIWRRDRSNHKSPNAAQTESACAGALGLQLAGDAQYFGKTVHKPYIGDPVRPVQAADIIRVNRLMTAASLLGELICLIMIFLVYCISVR